MEFEFAHKVGKTWNFHSKPGKPLNCSKFGVSRFTFQDNVYVIYKKNTINIFVISTLLT